MTDIRPKAGRRWAWLFALPFAAMLLLALPGCQGPLTPRDEPAAGTGVLSLTIGLERTRTILPVAPAEDFTNIRLEFTDYPLYHTVDYWDGETGIEGIPEGIWTLAVYAYVDADPVARGVAQNVDISADGSGEATVTIAPLPDGTGVFSWYIDVPAGVDLDLYDSILQIWNWPLVAGADPLDDVPALVLDDDRIVGSHTLDVGVYLAVFTLVTDDDGRVELTAILHILRNMESIFTHDEIEDDDFEPGGTLLDFIVGAWNDHPAVDFADAVSHAHFAIIGVNGVTAGNFDQLIYWFEELLEDDPFPGTVTEIGELVDAAIVSILGGTDAFMYAPNHIGRTEVEEAIREHLYDYGNNTQIEDADFDWEYYAEAWPHADTLTVTIGGRGVTIQFIMTPPAVNTVTILPPGPIDFVVGSTPDVNLTATLETTPPGTTFDITWTSSTAHVIFVDAAGNQRVAPVTGTSVYVRGITDGTANIIATADGVPSTAVVVNVIVPTVYSVTIDTVGPVDLYVDDDDTLTAIVVSNPAGVDFPVVWTVNNANVRFVGAGDTLVDTITTNAAPHTVTIRGVSEGPAIVTATANGEYDTVAVTVEMGVTPALVPFTWTFDGGQPIIAGETAGTISTETPHVNNMTLFGNRLGDGILWNQTVSNAPAPVGAVAHAPGAGTGRIQATGNTNASYFLSISDVQGPFLFEVWYANTGNEGAARNLVLMIDNIPTQTFAIPSAASGLPYHNLGQARRHGTFRFEGTEMVDIQLRHTNALRIYQIRLNPLPEQVVTVDPPTPTVAAAGGTQEFTANVTPSNGTVTWRVTPHTAGTINADGLLTVAAGAVVGSAINVIATLELPTIDPAKKVVGRAIVTVAPAPSEDVSFTINWTGFTNPLAQGVTITRDSTTGIISINDPNDVITSIQWLDEDLYQIGTTETLDLDDLPPLVTVRVRTEGSNRTYSIVFDTVSGVVFN